jgi:hypothetical protein
MTADVPPTSNYQDANRDSDFVGSPSETAAVEADAEEVLDAEIVDWDTLVKDPAANRMYVVPQRFGMSAILGIMTALAVLFGVLQRLDAHPFVYLFLGVMSLVICLVQMCFGGVPRMASVAAGTIVFALFVLSIPFVVPRVPIESVLCLFVLSLPFGGLLGYLTGTCAAGIFLIMDQLERYFGSRRDAEISASTTVGGTP